MTNYLTRKKAAIVNGMKENKGFSLVELIIVVAIMAVLVGVLAPNLIRYIESSREGADISTINQVHSSLAQSIATTEGVVSGTTVTVAADGGIASTDSALQTELHATIGDNIGVRGSSVYSGEVFVFTYTIDTTTKVSKITLNNAAMAGELGLGTT